MQILATIQRKERSVDEGDRDDEQEICIGEVGQALTGETGTNTGF